MRYAISKYLDESERIPMSVSSFTFLWAEAGEMAQWFKALTVPTEDQGSVSQHLYSSSQQLVTLDPGDTKPFPGHCGN